MTSDKTILVLGGGIGGAVVARRLRTSLPRTHRVVLIERETKHLFQPSLLWLMTGARTPRSITQPMARLARRGIELIHGEVERINPETRAVQVAGQEIRGDYMVIALGAEYATETIPGLSSSGHNFYTPEGAESLHQALTRFRQGRLVVLVGGIPFKCPAAPYEAVMLLEAVLRKRGVRDNVSVDLYTPEPGPMPVAGSAVSMAVRQMVESKGVRLHTEHAVTQVDVSACLIHFKNGMSASFDLLAYVPPHRAPAAVRESGLTGESGWIPVNKKTLETKYPGIFAIGDVASIPLAIGKPLPKAGVFAHGQAEVVAHNILHAITGKGEPRSFAGHGACFVETGAGRAGFGSGNFFAEPAPLIRLRPPSRLLHLSKVAYEQYWLYRWF